MGYPLLTDRQCTLFLNDIREFGYENTEFEEIRKMANDLHNDIVDEKDPIAIILRDQVKEAMEAVSKRRSW